MPAFTTLIAVGCFAIPLVPVHATDILLVVDSVSGMTTDETARKTQFENWGHTVTVIEDSDSQANFDAAVALVDLAYVNEEVTSASLGSKLREASIGVISEESNSDDEFGFANAAGTTASATSISIVDNTHELTAGLSIGSLAITGSNQPFISTQGALAPDARTLATVAGQPALVVIDEGGTLATTYNGSTTAFGRRIRLPIAQSDFSWSALTSDGLQLLQNAIEWASSSDSLVLHLKLDETAGTTAVDSSVTANDGSYTHDAAPGAAGPGVSSGLAASFDGVDDKITVPSNSAYDITDAITVSAWVNFDQAIADQTAQQSLVSRFTWSGKKGFQLFTDQPSSNSLRFRLLNGSWKDAVWSNPDVEAGGWRHVVGTYDGATIRLYVDGELKASNNQNNALAAHTGGDLSLGSNLNGRLADVQIHNRVLSATEIADLHGLVGHWELSETSGAVADDSTILANDGAYQGSATAGAAGPTSGSYAAEFDGVPGSLIDLPDANHDFSGGVTMAVWYRLNSLSGAYTDFFSLSNGLLVDDVWLGLDGSGRLDLFLSDTADGADYRGLIEDSAGAMGEWHHAVAVIDASGNATLYRNGETVKSGYVGLPRDVIRTQNGIGETSFEHTLDGRLADVRLYNRPLSLEEVSDIYGLGTGLVGHWKLSETSGTTAVDSSASGNDGTYTNGVAVDQDEPYPGVTAPEFDGVDDHVALAPINANFQNGLTIAAWIKPDSTLSSGQFHEIFELSNGSEVDQVLLSYSGVAGLQLFLSDTADGSSIKTIEDNTGFTAGRWVHCVATVDSSGYATIYRNGQVTKSGFFTSLPTAVSRGTVTIGKSSFGDHFGGGLQDVRLYNYELTPAEIHELYGLVGHWDFDEGTGTTIAESTGVASDAAFSTGTPEWIDGVRGSALEFDGTNDARSDETIEPPATGAVAFWMRSDGPPVSRQRPWGIGADYEIWQDTDGLVSMDISTDGYQGGFITTDALHSESRWYHIVALYDSDADSYEIYLDGQLHKSGVATWSIEQQASNYLSFGTRTGSSQRFSGALDDFRIYNRWLNTAEIAEIYGLVGWWRMEETSGSTVSDSSGAGNHGTVVGAPAWSGEAKESFGSIELDGTNYVEVPGLLVNGQSASVTGWANLTNADSRGAEIISLGDHLGIRLDSDTIGTQSWIYDGSEIVELESGQSHENMGWHHFAASYDERSLELKFYIDGVLRASRTTTNALNVSGLGTNTRIGRHGDTQTNRDFTGLLDDIRVYNRTINPDEARTLFYGGYVPGLRIVKWVEVANP